MSAADPACPDYPNECVHPWAHARTYSEIKAAEARRIRDDLAPVAVPQPGDSPAPITDAMIDAFNRAYSSVYEASAPITTQAEVVAVERKAIRAGLAAALLLAAPTQPA